MHILVLPLDILKIILHPLYYDIFSSFMIRSTCKLFKSIMTLDILIKEYEKAAINGNNHYISYQPQLFSYMYYGGSLNNMRPAKDTINLKQGLTSITRFADEIVKIECNKPYKIYVCDAEVTGLPTCKCCGKSSYGYTLHDFLSIYVSEPAILQIYWRYLDNNLHYKHIMTLGGWLEPSDIMKHFNFTLNANGSSVFDYL